MSLAPCEKVVVKRFFSSGSGRVGFVRGKVGFEVPVRFRNASGALPVFVSGWWLVGVHTNPPRKQGRSASAVSIPLLPRLRVGLVSKRKKPARRMRPGAGFDRIPLLFGAALLGKPAVTPVFFVSGSHGYRS